MEVSGVVSNSAKHDDFHWIGSCLTILSKEPSELLQSLRMRTIASQRVYGMRKILAVLENLEPRLEGQLCAWRCEVLILRLLWRKSFGSLESILICLIHSVENPKAAWSPLRANWILNQFLSNPNSVVCYVNCMKSAEMTFLFGTNGARQNPRIRKCSRLSTFKVDVRMNISFLFPSFEGFEFKLRRGCSLPLLIY